MQAHSTSYILPNKNDCEMSIHLDKSAEVVSNSTNTAILRMISFNAGDDISSINFSI